MLAFSSQTGFQRSRNFHIIVSVDAENILNHVTITLHIHTIRRNGQCQSFHRLISYLHFQARHNALDCLYRNHFTNQRMYFLVRQVYYEILCRSSIYIFYFRRDSTACQLFYHYGSQFQTVNHTIRVDAAFKAERSIGIQAVTTGRLTHPCRMEISTFDENIRCSFRRAGIQSAKYARNAHGFFLIANHQVAVTQLTFHLVQCNERSSFGHCLYDNFITLYLTGIKAMQRLSESMDNVISDIHYIINRTHTDQTQFILQPFRTFLYSHSFHGNTGIMRTRFTVFNLYFNIQIMVFHFKVIHRRTLQSCLLTVLNQISIQVTGYPVVRACIRTVRSDIHFKHIIALDIIIIFGKSTRDSIFRQNDDTCMIRTDTDFIFSTNHTCRFYTADF